MERERTKKKERGEEGRGWERARGGGRRGEDDANLLPSLREAKMFTSTKLLPLPRPNEGSPKRRQSFMGCLICWKEGTTSTSILWLLVCTFLPSPVPPLPTDHLLPSWFFNDNFFFFSQLVFEQKKCFYFQQAD
jgi:hypothetical protein